MPSHMRPIACEKPNADSNNNLSCFHLSHELDTASINCSSATPAQPMCSKMHIKETMQRDNDQAIKSLAHVLRGMLEEQSLSLHANADWESQYPLDQTMINIIGGENNTNGDVFSPALAPHNQLEEYVNELVPALQLINKTTHNLDLKQRQEAIKLTADAVLARRAAGMAWSSALSNRLGTYNINNNPINETQIHGVTGMLLEDPDFVNAMECASSACIKTPVSSEGNSCENAFSDDFGAFGSSLASSEHSSMVDSTSDLNMDDHDGLNYVQSDDKCPAMEIRSNSEAQRSVISELVMDNDGSNHFQSYPLYEEINAEFRHRSCESNGVVQWASNSMESSGLISAPVSDVMEVRRLERESMSGYARASMDKSADGLTGGRLMENVMGQYSCSINGGNPCAGADISVGNPCVNAENTEDSAPWERLHAAGIMRAKLDAANVLMKVGKPSPAGNMSSSGEGDGGATAVSPQNGSSLIYGMKARNADMEVSVLSYHGTAEGSVGMHAGDDGLEAARGMAADGMEGEEKEEEDMQGSQNAASSTSMTMMYGGSSCDDHGHQGGLTSMREAVYTLSAYQPIDWSSVMQEGSKERPKRRNVRVSKDPQSVAARRRRERISDRIRILQRLVPGGAKLDTASMLDEAIQYLKFLKMQVQALGRLERYFTSLPQPAHHAYYRHHHLNAAAPPLRLHHVQI